DSAFSFLNESDKFIYQPVLSRQRPKKYNPVNLIISQSHAQSFIEFLRPFNGVATKYLQNYLNWFHYKERIKMRVDKIRYSIKACLTGDKAMKWIEDLVIKDAIIIT